MSPGDYWEKNLGESYREFPPTRVKVPGRLPGKNPGEKLPRVYPHQGKSPREITGKKTWGKSTESFPHQHKCPPGDYWEKNSGRIKYREFPPTRGKSLGKNPGGNNTGEGFWVLRLGGNFRPEGLNSGFC
jgi:hypothetical protein